MKTILLAFLSLTISTTILAQSPTLTKKEQKKILKEERAKQKALELEQSAKLVEHMISRRRFVLEANMLFDKYGNSNSVQSSINFIAIDSLSGVIQIGNPMYIGSNGLGGITITGKVRNYKWEKNEKRGNYTVFFNISSTMGTYDVNMSIGGSAHADATVRGTFSGSIRYSGNLVHPAKSSIFKGNSRF